MKYSRGHYNEIPLNQLNSRTRSQVDNLIDDVQRADKIDEHGSWDFGSEFDGKGRGHALNWDLYGIGRDCHSRKTLIVIQVRQWSKTRRRGYANVRKSYFLVGRNENDTAFAHPVEARVVQYAAKRNRDVIRACQDWIFGGDYKKMKRQGDVAIIPLTRKPRGKDTEKISMLLEESHELEADIILLNGILYAKNPALTHTPGTHPHINGKGWYKVIVGRRGHFYRFATPTID